MIHSPWWRDPGYRRAWWGASESTDAESMKRVVSEHIRHMKRLDRIELAFYASIAVIACGFLIWACR